MSAGAGAVGATVFGQGVARYGDWVTSWPDCDPGLADAESGASRPPSDHDKASASGDEGGDDGLSDVEANRAEDLALARGERPDSRG